MLALDGPYAVGVIGPVVAITVTGVLALLLHRAFGKREAERSQAPSRPDDYGLLVPVATCRDRVDADLLRQHLATAGIRSTITAGADGRLRVLVFADALDQARRLVG